MNSASARSRLNSQSTTRKQWLSAGAPSRRIQRLPGSMCLAYGNERDLLHRHAEQCRRSALGRWKVQQAHREQLVLASDDVVMFSQGKTAGGWAATLGCCDVVPRWQSPQAAVLPLAVDEPSLFVVAVYRCMYAYVQTDVATNAFGSWKERNASNSKRRLFLGPGLCTEYKVGVWETLTFYPWFFVRYLF